MYYLETRSISLPLFSFIWLHAVVSLVWDFLISFFELFFYQFHCGGFDMLLLSRFHILQLLCSILEREYCWNGFTRLELLIIVLIRIVIIFKSPFTFLIFIIHDWRLFSFCFLGALLLFFEETLNILPWYFILRVKYRDIIWLTKVSSPTHMRSKTIYSCFRLHIHFKVVALPILDYSTEPMTTFNPSQPEPHPIYLFNHRPNFWAHFS